MGAGQTSRWPVGWWLGAAGLAATTTPTLDALVGEWRIDPGPPAGAAPAPPAVLVDAVGLDPGGDVHAVSGLIERLGGVDAPGAPDRRPPRRIIRVLAGGPPEWGRDPAAAARDGAVLAHVRALALRWAASGVTVNAIVVPAGFPDGPPSTRAPVQRTIGPEDLAHVLRYLLDPTNDYVIGQVVAICGGEDAWAGIGL